MQITPPSRESLLRYLLNEIDETERERIDTLLIADAEYAAQFQEVEYDLVDALAAGELAGPERARAKLALGTGDRFSPVHYKRASISHPEPIRSTDLASDPVRQDKILRPRLQAVRWLALAAILLIAVAIGISRFVSRPATTSPDVRIGAPAGHTGLAAGAIGEPQQTKALSVPPKGSPEPPPSPVMAMLLLPGASRSSTALRLPIPHEASVIQIDWPLPLDTERTARYQLQMLNDTGHVACTSLGTIRHGADGNLVRFRCNARSVSPGTGFVRVASAPLDPDAAPLLEVAVTVEKP